ncbi:MAG: ATP synthase F1 subunit delta [Candidatus Eremiobacteraeota bacterium]|nr:ATP synthase F1 subunit delta [Candidatus Eremiobacteraeota bacterium]
MSSVLLKAVARRYAEAIYAMAKKAGNIDEQLQELIKVREILKGHDELKRAVEVPTLPDQVKKSILDKLLKKRVSKTTLHFLFVLVDKSREVYLEPIISAYEQIQRDENSVVECHVRVPRALTKKLEASLVKRLEDFTGKAVELVVHEDETMLGGMVITIGDRIIDGSIETQLAQIQERLAKIGS